MDDKYSEMLGKLGADAEVKTFSLQMYEKGLISGKTLLEIVGFDPDQEIKRKEEDVVQLDLTHFDERRTQHSFQVRSQRIEHARRNVEALQKLLGYVADVDRLDNKKLIIESINKNIKIMEEVTKL